MVLRIGVWVSSRNKCLGETGCGGDYLMGIDDGRGGLWLVVGPRGGGRGIERMVGLGMGLFLDVW